MVDSKKPVELLKLDDDFISGSTGAFAEETPIAERVAITQRLSGLNVTEQQKKFIDYYIYNGFNELEAYNFIFNKNGEISTKEAKKEAKKLLSSVHVRNYLMFIKDQALMAMSINDNAEFYMGKIVDDLFASIESDIYDHLNYTRDDGGNITDISLKDPELLTKQQRRQVKKIKIRKQTDKKTGNIKIETEIETWDKTKNRDQMMKHLKMYTKNAFGDKQSSKVDEIMQNAEDAVATDVVTGKPHGSK